MTNRQMVIEAMRIKLDPSQEGIVRECFRIVQETLETLPMGTFSDEPSACGVCAIIPE